MFPHKQLPKTCSCSTPFCSNRIAAGATRRLRRSVAHPCSATTQQVGESVQQSRTKEEDAANAVVAHFSVKGRVAFGEWLRLVGSSEEFGRWGPFEGPLLKWHDGDIWKASIKLPCDLDNLEFKVVVCHEQGGPPGWEQGPNRVLPVPSKPGVLEHSCDLGKIDSGRSTFYPYIGEQPPQPQQQQNGTTDARQQAPSSSPSTNGKPSPQQLASASQQQQLQQQQQQPRRNAPVSQASGSRTSQAQGSSPSSPSASQAQEDVPEWYSLLGSLAISAAAGGGCFLLLALNDAATLNKQRAEALRAGSTQAEQLRSFSIRPSSIPAPAAAPSVQGR